jgi:uncharacterized protein (TIRG00374 family)
MAQEGEGESRGRNWRGWALALILFAAVVGAVLHFGELQHFAALLQSARPGWLVPAAALQALTYLCVAAGWNAVLQAAGKPLPLGDMFQLALARLFTDQAVPAAGMGGNVLVVDRLIARGVPRGTAAAALIVDTIGTYAGFGVLGLAALLLLWIGGRATFLLVVTVFLFLGLCIAVPAGWLWLWHRGKRELPGRLGRIRTIRTVVDTVAEAPPDLVRDRRLIVRVTLYSAGVALADAATLWVCLRAIGVSGAYAASFIALMVAQMVVILGPVPLGLGAFEGACAGTLRLLGVPIEAAITATLLLRGFTLWLPLIPGMIVTRRLTKWGEEDARPAPA